MLRGDVILSEVDARQRSLFGAAWTIGSLARLASLDGVHSLTYFETTGPCGVMEFARGSQRAELFPSPAGAVFPMFHIFAALGGANVVAATRSTEPTRFDGFCVEYPDRQRCWMVANLTAAPLRAAVVTQTASARICILDETNAAEAMAPPHHLASTRDQQTVRGRLNLELRPYAIAKIMVAEE